MQSMIQPQRQDRRHVMLIDTFKTAFQSCVNISNEHRQANGDDSTLSIYKFSNYILKDRKYLSYILKIKFKRLMTLSVLMSRFGLRFLFGCCWFFFLNLLRSMIIKAKFGNSLLWLILSSLSRKRLIRTYMEIFCVAFFVFSANINKLFN